MKVDVIVKQNFVDDLRAELNTGGLNPDEYLTARFAIPEVFVSSTPTQNGQPRDLYQAPVDLGAQPLRFEKDGEVVHKLCPVEAYVVDNQGNRIDSGVNNPAANIRTGQVWQLQPGSGGLAEMSVNLGDLANAPQGDLVIDPSMEFGASDQDTLLRYLSSGSNFGNFDVVDWQPNDILLFGFDTFALGTGISIHSAELQIFAKSNTIGSGIIGRARKVKVVWSEGEVSWDSNWENPGTNDADPDFSSPSVTLPSTDNQWISFDVSYAFKSHVTSSFSDVQNKGFSLRMENASSGHIDIVMKEYSTDTSKRPKLTVEYGFTQFGADAGFGNNDIGNEISVRQNRVVDDGMQHIRFFDNYENDPNADFIDNFFNTNYPFTSNPNIRVIVALGAIDYLWAGKTANDYANRVEKILSMPHVNQAINEGRLIGIELGNEEAQGNNGGSWDDTPVTGFWAGGFSGGYNYADYYLAAYDKVKNNPSYPNWQVLDVISSTTFDKSYALAWTAESDSGSSAEFLKGFIDGVIDKGGREKFPDVIQIHNYADESPEFFEKNIGDPDQMTEFFDRLKQITNICLSKGVLPSFAQTEFGYSPRPDYKFAQGNIANLDEGETAQAVYYLRGRFITGTSQPYNGIGWKYDLYFQHPNNWNPNDLWDSGFWVTTDPSFGGNGNVRRKVSETAFLLHDTSNPLQFGSPGSKIWLPQKRVKPPSGSDPGMAWCGWETSSGQQWGAIWLYQWSLSPSFPYYKIAPISETFKIPGNVASQYDRVEVYKFNFNNSPVTLSGPIETIFSNNWTFNGTDTEIQLGNVVDEEPAILKFIQSS